jgi:ATP/maltotriose-dependent transcriptional regulator MalT
VAELETSADIQEREAYAAANATILLATGKASEALAIAGERLGTRQIAGLGAEYMKEMFALALTAAFELDDHQAAERIIQHVEALPPGRLPQVVQAHVSRFRAQLAAGRGEGEEAERLYKRAAGLFRELAVPFYLSVTQLHHAEMLVAEGRAADAEPLLAEAGAVFEKLRARPWLERCDAAIPGGARVHAEAT